MEAGEDEYWLSGNPSWWPSAKDKKQSDWVALEIDSPESWSGWRRQRLQPMAARFVLGPAWSIAILTASTFPLLLPGNTPNDQTVASILFYSAFVLLHIPALRIASALPDGDGLALLKWLWFGDGVHNLVRTLGLTFLGGVAFVAHIVVDVRLGWLSYALFVGLWFHLTYRTANAMIPPSGRWVLPLAGEYDGSGIDDSWEIDSRRFRGGRLAFKRLSNGRRVELHGVNRGGEKFLAVHLRHPSSLLYDPFVDTEKVGRIQLFRLGFCGPRLAGIEEHFTGPPIDVDAGIWPPRFLLKDEEE